MFDAPTVQKVELAAIRRLTSAAAAGTGGALVITGPPGSGRSTVLQAAAALADDTAWTVATVRGHPGEAGMPLHGLRSLDPAGSVTTGPDLLARFCTITRDGPVLCLIDDAHLLDPESWQALAYAARRAAGHRIAIVMSFPAGAEPAGLPVHRLAPLTAENARALLGAHAPGLVDDVAATLIALAGGNPAALIELAGALTPEQRRGYAPPPATLPPDSPLHRRFTAGLDTLPARTRHLVHLAATAPGTAPGVLLAAASLPSATVTGLAEAAGQDRGEWRLADFAAAERAGIIQVTATEVRFAEELRRVVTYRQMEVARRQAAHLALAEALAAHGEPAVALLHRGEAATGPDSTLAGALTAAAGGADPQFAAAARQVAARLTPAAGERADLLVAAARDYWRAGRPHEAQQLLRRLPGSRDPGSPEGPAGPERSAGPGIPEDSGRRGDSLSPGSPEDSSGRGGPGTAWVRARWLSAEMRLAGGRPETRDILLDVAADLADSEPVAALEALALAGEAVCRPGEQARYAALARRVTDGRRDGGGRRGDERWQRGTGLWDGEPAATALLFAHVGGLARIAEGDDEGAFGPLRQAVALAARVTEPKALLRAAVAGVLVGDARRAAAVAGRAAVLAREQGSPLLVPQALELAALAGMASGDHAAAGESALDGAAVAGSTGQPLLAGAHLGILAVLAALAGDRATTLSRIAAVGTGPSRPLCEWALALLDLVDGRGRPAAGRLLTVVTAPPGPGAALLRVAVVPHLLEAAAAARTGTPPVITRSTTEEEVAEAFDRWAGRTGQPGWLALRDRCRALRSGDGEEAAAHFEAALGHDGEGGFPRAHTELLYGRMLRRRRRHVAARAHLRRAAETFQALDAGPWAALSVREMRAAGARTGSADPERLPAPAAGELTAQQERIATLVAGGATNREVAQELHLSPRTVDHHLRNVYTRLGVRSRTEMARLLARGQDQPPAI
ncbi:MAG TPA: LuxR C-terminal-related transcriptional regulator [Actinoplanes sp.]|nr:LuxR C-terminal-related transcriptional regulator [Actinoplanes sp.]